jgi:hypothetical protein
LQVLAISGSVGVGKSAALIEIHDILEHAHVPHACIERDALGYSWPAEGRFNEGIIEKNLACIVRTFQDSGASRIVIAGVLETKADLDSYRRSIPNAEITVCRLTADLNLRRQRLMEREIGAGLTWHLARTEELDRIQDASNVVTFTVDNGTRPIREVAQEILRRSGWSAFLDQNRS